jgi:hypothetical protein
MDRVLLVIDDIQYNRQVEMTLRKLGFEVDSVNNEFSLNEPLLGFNPDYIVVKGQGQRLNILSIAKKLKEASNHNNKVILVFPENFQLSSDELFSLRADLILNEPISTLRLVMHLISLSDLNIEFVKEKLLKYAITDSQFRTGEQQLLKSAGVTIDSEIELLSNIENIEQLIPPSNLIAKTRKPLQPTPEPPVIVIIPNEQTDEESLPFVISDEAKNRLLDELVQSKNELQLRIDTYNRLIKAVDQDLKVGLKKRQTKKEFNQLRKDLMAENKADKNSEKAIDSDRIIFTKALFKK